MSLSLIPLECTRSIMVFLPFADIFRFMALSKELYSISRTSAVWNTLYYRKWPGRKNRGGYRYQEPVGRVDWLSRFRDRFTSVRPSSVEYRWSVFDDRSSDVVLLRDPVVSIIHAPCADHICNSTECTFTQVKQDEFRCDYSGFIHVCEPCRDGFACLKSIESVSDSLWVCPISARSFQFTAVQYPTLSFSDSDSDQALCPILKRQRR